jgi:Domain of unknown function (DUF6950)
MIVRKQSWDIDMGGAIEAAAARPFAWGTNDCSLFACDVVLAMTGTDLGADFRGKYDSRESAAEIIAFATDGGDLEALVEQICVENQIPEVDVAFAWRGDIALHDTSEGPCLGIIDLEGGRYLTENHGLRIVPRDAIRRTWRV